ncbi:MAG: hypothetical protein WBK55_09735 [Alphaproteobacteria bacterium]
MARKHHTAEQIISMGQFVEACIEQITVQADRLEIKIKVGDLSALLSDVAKVKIDFTESPYAASLSRPKRSRMRVA